MAKPYGQCEARTLGIIFQVVWEAISRLASYKMYRVCSVDFTWARLQSETEFTI